MRRRKIAILIALLAVLAPGLLAMPAPASAADDLDALVRAAGLIPWRFKSPADFELTTLDGTAVTLRKDLANKVVLMYMYSLG